MQIFLQKNRVLNYLASCISRAYLREGYSCLFVRYVNFVGYYPTHNERLTEPLAVLLFVPLLLSPKGHDHLTSCPCTV